MRNYYSFLFLHQGDFMNGEIDLELYTRHCCILDEIDNANYL